MHHADYPEVVARFYDVIYHNLRTSVDHEFYFDKAYCANGPVLELGVGTGRLFCASLEKGVDIYGVDASKAMLKLVKSKLDEQDCSRVKHAFAQDFQFDQKFDLIVAPFRLFQHLLSIEDQLKALNNVAKHLTSNGKLIFDVFLPNVDLLKKPVVFRKQFSGEWAPGKKLERFYSQENNFVKQQIEVTFHYFWNENGNQRDKWNFPMRYFWAVEMEHLIARSNLQLDTIHGDFQGSPVTPESREMIVTCKL